MVSEYAAIPLPAVEHLDYFVYLQLRRDAWIAHLSETSEGREYLDNAWRLTQTEPDRKGLRSRFKRS